MYGRPEAEELADAPAQNDTGAVVVAKNVNTEPFSNSTVSRPLAISAIVLLCMGALALGVVVALYIRERTAAQQKNEVAASKPSTASSSSPAPPSDAHDPARRPRQQSTAIAAKHLSQRFKVCISPQSTYVDTFA